MDLAQATVFVRIILGLAGSLSIYCGYKLFCGIPLGKNRAANVIHGISGALLALFGMAILVADAHGVSQNKVTASRPAMHHSRPAEAGSFTPRSPERRRISADWTI